MKNKFKIGDNVYWEDPDELKSGIYEVIDILEPVGKVNTYFIGNNEEDIEAYEYELSEV